MPSLRTTERSEASDRGRPLRKFLASLGSELSFDLTFSMRARAVGTRATTVIIFVVTSLAVALITSIEVASRSASISASQWSKAAQGRSQIEIAAGDAGIPEELLPSIRKVPGVASASPVVERAVRPVVAGTIQEQIQLFGIEISNDRDPRDFSVVREGYRQRDLSQYSTTAGMTAIPSRLAGRLGLSEGDELRALDVNREIHLTVRGMLEGALGDAQDGNIALVDWRTAQDVLGLRGRISRVDITLGNAAGVADVIAILQSRIGSVATVREAGYPDRFLEGMFLVYQTGMWAVGAIAILASLLLLFSISASSVDQRAEEFRLLHAVGMSLSRLRRLVVLEAILLCGGAVGLGLALAPLLAGLTMERLASTSPADSWLASGDRWNQLVVDSGRCRHGNADNRIRNARTSPSCRKTSGTVCCGNRRNPSDHADGSPATGRDGPYRNTVSRRPSSVSRVPASP